MATPTWIQAHHTLLTKSVNANQGVEDEANGYKLRQVRTFLWNYLPYFLKYRTGPLFPSVEFTLWPLYEASLK